MKLNTNQLAVLRKAREILTEPRAWTQGAGARDAFGRRAKVRGETATCFCSLGATARAERELDLDLERAEDAGLDDALSQAMHSIRPIDTGRGTGWAHIAAWNDDPATGHKQVLQAFDLAIARGQ